MKYEVPVCEIIEFSVEDVITTSIPVSSTEKGNVPSGSDTVVMPVDSDNGSTGGASN